MAGRMTIGHIDVPGFYAQIELDALAEAASEATGHIVEIGSFKGRSLVAIAMGARAATVWSIDPHEGVMTGRNNPNGIPRLRPRAGPSEMELRRTVNRFGLGNVRIIVGRSTDTTWRDDRPIGMLHVDGDHARGAPLADFRHFEPHLESGAIVAFHDYRPRFSGVVEAVDRLVGDERIRHVRTVHSLWIGLRVGSSAGHN